MSFRTLLNRDAVVERKVRTHDGQGGFSVGWQEIQRARVRVRPLAAGERMSAGGMRAELTHRLYAALTFLGRRGDRVRLAPFQAGAPELVLEIDAVREPSSPHHIEVDCAERREDAAVH